MYNKLFFFISLLKIWIEWLIICWHFLVRTLSLSPTNGRKSWWQALGKCISESKCVLKELYSDCFDSGADEYDKLNFSMKLRLLNFLCDEALGTE